MSLLRAATVSTVVAALALVTGCSATTQGAAPAAPASAQTTQHWENRTLANGIELRVSDDASPEARQIAEQIQSEMRSRYISAR